MFENFTAGQTIRIYMAGSTQGLAMRATYLGEVDGAHHLSGIGVMADAKFAATETVEGWKLGNGRRLTKAEAV